MQKNFIIIGIIIFLLVTAIVLTTSESPQSKKVQITNQNFVIKNENTEVKSEDLNINLGKTNIANNNVKTKNKEIAITPTKKVEYKTLNPTLNNNTTKLNSTDYKFSNSRNNVNNKIIEYENQKKHLSNLEKALQKSRLANKNIKQERQQSRYLVRNIDWSTWKSNFVNAIIDGSMGIDSLNSYPEGSWFYYSFNVDREGRISNIKVHSIQISSEDKEKIVELIKSFQYSEVTVFPANSKRNTIKVDAVVLFGNTEKKARPSDFNDTEQVKIKFP